MGDKLDQTLAVLNGLVGDYLERGGNGLRTHMGCYHRGLPVVLDRAGLARAYPDATGRVALFVHGVMCTETIWRFPDGSDYGQKLQAELGITPVYVRYNSGLPIADNGAALAACLQQLVDAYPVPLEELILIGYSMGGLLVRSACHVASLQGLSWLEHVRRALYVGTPHLGTPAERLGRVVARVLRAIPDPYTRLVGEIGDLRSAGIKDLGDADLRHEDRAAVSGRLSLRDPRHPVALLPGIRHALVAGTLSDDPTNLAAFFGDSIVPVTSATAYVNSGETSPLDPRDVKVLPGRSHLDLPHDAEVYDFIRKFCEHTA
jgi:pimeloyl-ACP methyl ester carboxylesterase